MKIYIACPMTGFENFNRDIMFAKAKELVGKGYSVRHTADLPDGKEYLEYINISLERIRDCDAIYLMRGWERSRGVVKHELPLALELDLDIFVEGGESDL